MSVEFDQAIVLRLSDYSESSQIVTVFGRRNGLARLMAKGTRRSTRREIRVGLDLLDRGECRMVRPRGESTLGQMHDWKLRDGNTHLSRSLPVCYGALYACEILERAIGDWDQHTSLFDSLVQFFDALADRAPTDLIDPLVRFQAALVRATGSAPNLRSCVECGTPRDGVSGMYSATMGGYVCMSCAPSAREKRSLPRSILLERPGQSPSAAWFDLLDYHIAHTSGRPSRTGAALRGILNIASDET